MSRIAASRKNLFIAAVCGRVSRSSCRRRALNRVAFVVTGVGLILHLFPAPIVAQQQDPSGPAGQAIKGAVIKGKAPVNKEVLRVKLPRASEATLKNGLRVMVLEN